MGGGALETRHHGRACHLECARSLSRPSIENAHAQARLSVSGRIAGAELQVQIRQLAWSQSRGAGTKCRSADRETSLNVRLRLLAHVLRQIIERGDRLAGGARSLPAAEGLIAGPSSRGSALGAVGVRHARLDMLEKPGNFFRSSVEAGSQTKCGGVRERHGVLSVADPL